MSYDIAEQEVKIELDGVTLGATLALPPDLVDPTKAVVLVAGSGPTDRDGNSPLLQGRIDNLKDIAHYLANRGFLVLRYDKRAIGASTVLDPTAVTFQDYADDLIGVASYLRENPLVSEVYVLGHSEGALFATMAALAEPQIAGIGLLAGPGFRMKDVLRRQLMEQAKMAESLGMGDTVSRDMEVAVDDLYQAMAEKSEFNAAGYGLPEAFAGVLLSVYMQPNFTRDWLMVDPAAMLAEVTCPVLIVQGDMDLQVLVADAQQLAKNKPEADIHILPGVDHALKMTEGVPLPLEDGRPVDIGVLKIIAEWLLCQ